MRLRYLFCLFLVFGCTHLEQGSINRNYSDNDLLHEYNLLYIDLQNVNTYGYKSFFNPQNNRASEDINFMQGSLLWTNNKTDFAIIGEGFIKIRLENDLIGYTRYGHFYYDSEGNLVTLQGYFFYDNIKIENDFLPLSLKIDMTGNVFTSIIERGELIEKEIGKILIYKIPDEYLRHYDGAIYVIKDNVDYNEEIIDFDDYYGTRTRVIQECLEISNLWLPSAALRMYYILSVLDDKVIPNIEFKKELLKMLIESHSTFSREELILSIYGRIVNINELLRKQHIPKEEIQNIFSNDRLEYFEYEQYLRSRTYFLETILPFIKSDY